MRKSLNVATFIYRHLQGNPGQQRFTIRSGVLTGSDRSGAAQVAAVHCQNERTLDPAVCSQTDPPMPQSAALWPSPRNVLLRSTAVCVVGRIGACCGRFALTHITTVRSHTCSKYSTTSVTWMWPSVVHVSTRSSVSCWARSMSQKMYQRCAQLAPTFWRRSWWTGNKVQSHGYWCLLYLFTYWDKISISGM